MEAAAFNTLATRLRIPDLWQQEAVGALRAGRDVVVHAPTGAGKTYVFELRYPSLKGQAIFTVPTRALANDKFAEWRAAGWDVGIATGDLAERTDARVVVATLETQRGNALRRVGPRLLVVDEYQMLGDPQRGANYELALALAPPATQLLLLSGSVANPQDVAAWLRRLGRDVLLIRHDERPVPLEEVVVDQLPYRVDDGIRGYWPRLVAKALLGDLGPILLFAPRRQAAEDLARDLAAALPLDDPLALSAEQALLAGEPVARLLRRRVAFHHSGLPYAVRAGLIEPLAKAGQLRAVVATTGLAAGVNFSLRSVLITDTRYVVRHFERHLQPEELLQMFGRAGRRGLDERGYVLVAPGRPRLDEARPRQLKRANQIDWPTLVSVMGAPLMPSSPQPPQLPWAAAVELTQRLFSEQKVPLGVELSLADGPRACGLFVDAERARLAQPKSVELLNSLDQWEPAGAEAETPLEELFVQEKLPPSRWRPVLRDAAFMAGIGRGGNLCRLRRTETEDWVYGRELPLATVLSGHEVRLAKSLRPPLTALGPEWQGRNWPPGGRLGRLVFEERILPLIPALSGGGRLVALLERGGRLAALVDFSHVTRPARRDSAGRALFQPAQRKNYPRCCQHCPRLPDCERGDRAMTPALAWRQLGLVEADGAPTRRGRLFGFFQYGEGLAIAAALESGSYPIGDLLFDLANLRAGHRFAEAAGENPRSGRLASRCQEVYGRADFPGYLEMGVPPDYGDGAGAAILTLLLDPGSRHKLLGESLRAGDLERALIEWRSLLRAIAAAPDFDDWPRWRELRDAARRQIDAAPASAAPAFPPLPPAQQRRYAHRLTGKAKGES